MEPSKVFFGINLVRAKLKLPKLEYPKRKLAVTPDQLMAVESLYSPYLPLPPIGIHKIIAKQLRMDEWRVHVAIKLIRKNRDMPRWNEDREDAPPQVEKPAAPKAAKNKDKEAQKPIEAPKEAGPAAEAVPTLVETAVATEGATSAQTSEALGTPETPETPAPKKKTTTRKTKAIAAQPASATDDADVQLASPAAKPLEAPADAVVPAKPATTRSRKKKVTADTENDGQDAAVPLPEQLSLTSANGSLLVQTPDTAPLDAPAAKAVAEPEAAAPSKRGRKKAVEVSAVSEAVSEETTAASPKRSAVSRSKKAASSVTAIPAGAGAGVQE